MKGELSQPSRALELWRGEFCFKRIFCLSFYFSLPTFNYQFLSLSWNPLFAMKTMVVFIEKGGCKRVKEGWKGLLFCPPPAASRACQSCLIPFCWKKDKKSAEMGPGTQCRLALCFKILVSVGTWIKLVSAGLKIGVSTGTVLKN